MILRDYQKELSEKGTEILRKFGIVYFSMEVRTGKTITSLQTAQNFGVRKILFVTKKIAISSIKEDAKNFDFETVVINYESISKIKDSDFDVIILDEAHKLGTYPKPNNKYKEIKLRFGHLPMILLSGTMSPESHSQIFHQFHISNRSPFKGRKNFYRWADDFVTKGVIYTNYGESVDYSNADYDKIIGIINPLVLTYTQNQAGFVSKIDERVLKVKMKDVTYSVAKRIVTDKIIQSSKGVILADTGVKEMQKLHQIYSGTIKFEDGSIHIFDTSKGEYIKEYFQGKKIGIFYKFKAEKVLLSQVFGDNITDDLDEFNSTDKNIMLQIVSGREGISLKKADFLVFFNIDFSAVSYWQSRDRLTTIDRKENTVFRIFSEGGIEEKIYETVQRKKDFTLKIYKQGKS